MSENISNKNVKNDEIEILDLLGRMGRTIKKWSNAVGRLFLIITVFLLRRWLPLGLSIAIGIGISYLMKFTSPSIYTSDMVLKNNSVTTSEMIAYINRLHTFCYENNKAGLAKALDVKSESVDNILDISAFWIIDKGADNIPDYVDYNNNHNVYDTINIRMSDQLDIRVKTMSTQELTQVRNSIISYIKKDSLFQQNNRLRLRQDYEILNRLSYDIKQLDSLQKVKYFEETRNRVPQNGGQVVFMQEPKTQLVYTDIYNLYTRKQILESNIELYKDLVTILSDFSLPAKRDNGAMFYGKKIIPFAFFATLLLLILMANKTKLTEVYKKY